MYLWCVQEVAELKEEDIISHTATATQLHTATDTQLPTATDTQLPTATATQLPAAAAGVSGDISRTLSELQLGECPCYYVLITAENDLCDVLAVIRDLNDWKDLGLQLGLLYSTLKKIDLEERGIINSCKIEMLSAWLQQQDNVFS